MTEASSAEQEITLRHLGLGELIVIDPLAKRGQLAGGRAPYERALYTHSCFSNEEGSHFFDHSYHKKVDQ